MHCAAGDVLASQSIRDSGEERVARVVTDLSRVA
jgi:hypothetical protein